jgi:hypothetical protein
VYVSAYYYICVRILLYMCPHTTVYLSSTTTTICVSAYYYICVLILLYVSLYMHQERRCCDGRCLASAGAPLPGFTSTKVQILTLLLAQGLVTNKSFKFVSLTAARSAYCLSGPPRAPLPYLC